MSQIKATDLVENQRSITEVYSRLCTVSNNIPDYDPDKKGFDMCLMLLKEELADCWYVNQLHQIKRLELKNDKLKLENNDLKEDKAVLLRRIKLLTT